MLTGTRLRAVSWMLMAVVAVAALVYGTIDEGAPQSNAERAAAIAGTIACPECDGQPVSESNATIAEIIRAQIKTQVDQGLTEAEIRQVYVDEYGEWVDLSPSRSGLTGVVWIAPFLITGIAVGALALAFSRWRGDGSQEASEEDRALVEAARADSGGGTGETAEGIEVDEG